MKNEAQHIEWKPALGAKEIKYLGQEGNVIRGQQGSWESHRNFKIQTIEGS